MDKPKTVTDYIELLKLVDSVKINNLGGFDKEQDDVQYELKYLSDTISDRLAYIFLSRI